MEAQYRISVTTLEKFRRYMTETSSFDTEASLIESLKGIFLGNDKTKVGSAFHKLIEGDFKKVKGAFIAEGIAFNRAQAKVAFDYKQRHDFMVHEISIRKIYHTAFFPIQVSARVDGAEGFNIHDTKTKFRSPDVQEYIDSSQWKFYLDMLEADVFYYDLFEVKNFKELGPAPYRLHKEVEFVPHDPLQCIRYNDMIPDIMQLLNNFLEYLHNRNFLHLLKPSIEEPVFDF